MNAATPLITSAVTSVDNPATLRWITVPNVPTSVNIEGSFAIAPQSALTVYTLTTQAPATSLSTQHAL